MEIYTISELAKELSISTRAIRYYEERGLIHPRRTARGVRYYGKKERTALLLILRGKKFGFSLEEIHEMLTLFDQDRTGKKQLRKTIEYCRMKEQEVAQKIEDLKKLRSEILEVLKDFEQRLQELDTKPSKGK